MNPSTATALDAHGCAPAHRGARRAPTLLPARAVYRIVTGREHALAMGRTTRGDVSRCHANSRVAVEQRLTNEQLGTALLRYRAGDERALQVIVAGCEAQMRRVARRFTPCDADADDAVQDAWLSFARHCGSIETPAAVAGWLCKTVRHAAIAIARRTDRFHAIVEPPGVPGPTEDEHCDVLELDSRRCVLRHAVARLTDNERELLWLIFNGDLSYVEIAARTGRPVGGIGPNRGRILAKLRKDAGVRRWLLAESA